MKHLCLLACIVLLAACKKENNDPMVLQPPTQPLTDFKLIPVRDATWSLHTQGIYKNGKVDMSVHFHTTITCSGVDTITYGKRYFRYNYSNENGNGVIYIREDSAKGRLYAQVPGYSAPEGLVLDYGRDSIGDEALVPQQWPASLVSSEDSIALAGQYMKSWNVTLAYDKTKKYFYRAYGVGGQTGILPSLWIAQGTQPVSLDFTYKGETVHFDFDVY
jgi:hypothetical protein